MYIFSLKIKHLSLDFLPIDSIFNLQWIRAVGITTSPPLVIGMIFHPTDYLSRDIRPFRSFVADY